MSRAHLECVAVRASPQTIYTKDISTGEGTLNEVEHLNTMGSDGTEEAGKVTGQA